MSDQEEDLHNLLFGVRRSVCYHVRRSRTYGCRSRLISFCNIAGGSSAVASLLTGFGGDFAPLVASATVAILSIVDLVYGVSKGEWVHKELARRFQCLEAEIRKTENPQQGDVRRWVGERLEIEKDEPPKLAVLDVICHNELLLSDGYDPTSFAPVGPIQRLFSDMIDWRPSSLRAGRYEVPADSNVVPLEVAPGKRARMD